jgi:hypothetical protein
MGYEKEELKESAASVAWWLSPENSEDRRELAERRPELGQWLQMIERKVSEKLAEIEVQEEVRAKV